MTQFGYQPSLTSMFFPVPLRRTSERLGNPQFIIRSVCRAQRVSEGALKGRCRSDELVRIRRLIADRLFDLGLSYPEIGRLLNRHHSTIHNLRHPKHQRHKMVSGLDPSTPAGWSELVSKVERLFFQHRLDTYEISIRLGIDEPTVCRALATTTRRAER